MRVLTVGRHPQGIPGLWIIKHGNTVLASLVQSNLDVSLGIKPTADDVRQAVRDISPGYGVTAQTPVKWTGVD